MSGRGSTAGIAEPFAQLPHQLEEFRSAQPRPKRLPESLWSPLTFQEKRVGQKRSFLILSDTANRSAILDCSVQDRYN